MTVSTAPTPLSYNGNGSTTDFAITWKYNAKSHVVATLRSSAGVETTWALTTNYTLTDPGDSGTLTAVVAPATGEKLVITLEPPNTQTSSIPLGGDLPSTTLEDGLDLDAQRAAKVEALFLRALRVPRTDARTGSMLELPIDTDRAGNFLAFDASGDPIASSGSTSSGDPISAFMATVLDDTTAADARTTLGAIGDAIFDAKGDLIVGTAADTTARKAVGTDGFSLQAQSGATDGLQYIAPSNGYTLIGGYIDWTVSGNVLTVAIKGFDGNDPSTTNPVYALFRDVTAGTGSLTLRKITAATTIAINDTATLGTLNSTAFRIWSVLFDDGGTLRLAVINCLKNVVGPPKELSIFPLSGWGIASSTLEDASSDSAHVFYSDAAAVTSKSYAVLGYATWESGLATAGTWSSGPTRKQLFGPDVPLPGVSIQSQMNQTGALATGTTVLPSDDTIPQNTEGDQYMSQAITPVSSANVLEIETIMQFGLSSGDNPAIALFQDTTAGALAAMQSGAATTNARSHALRHRMVSGTTSSTTFKIRAGSSSAGTTSFNGAAGSRLFGGVMASSLKVTEYQA